MSTKNQITGDTYDAAGNLMTIPGPGGATYVFNAENQMISTSNSTMQYVYDGDGNRVMKSGSKIYWFSGSEILDETDTAGSVINSSFNEYVFFGSARIARRDSSNNVFYYLTDQLGSSRVILQAGQTNPCYDADFEPFGGEHKYADTCPQNYKFTGKERDVESQLDNFGARYYASTTGRFMSPDWALKPVSVPYAKFGDPQTLNLYTYVQNSPLNRIDADGHDGKDKDGTTNQTSDGGKLDSATHCPNGGTLTCSPQPPPQDTYKSKDAAAKAAGEDMRKRENGYGQEYGARIHKDGKKYSYGPVVTNGPNDPKHVDLPAVQKNDVGDIHTHNNRMDENPEVMGQSDQQSTVRDMDAVRKMNPGAKQDYDSYVLTPKGDLIKFTPDTSGPAGWGEPRVVDHHIAPDPNPQQ